MLTPRKGNVLIVTAVAVVALAVVVPLAATVTSLARQKKKLVSLDNCVVYLLIKKQKLMVFVYVWT